MSKRGRRPGRPPVLSKLVVVITACASMGVTPTNASAQALKLERTIDLAGVEGRIDHMALDAEAGRLFVAALGANSVEIIDVRVGHRIQRLQGLAEPQGVAWLAARRQLIVAQGTGARVEAWRDGEPVARVGGLEDADNIRVDVAAGRLYVGYGAGLAVLEAATLRSLGRIPLPGHAEAFELSPSGPEIFVNVPSARVVAVVNRQSGKTVGSWDTGNARGNFPMALDARGARLFVATRRPPRLLVYDTRAGRRVADLALCGDADDLFFDGGRHRLYAICGEGVVEVITQDTEDRYRISARVTTARGARTGLFSPVLSELYVAAPAKDGHPATVSVFGVD